jgi:Mu-like prophage I protein
MKYVIVLSGNGGKLSRMPLAQLGVRYKGKHRIEITRLMMADVVRNFRKLDTGEVPVDYDHSIELAAGNGLPCPAAGWIRAIDDVPDRQGILWCSVDWTERAQKMIATGEYRYVSPVIDPTVRDNKTGEPQGWTLTSAALTNTPVLKGMPALVLSETGWATSEGGAMAEPERIAELSRVSEEINNAVHARMERTGLLYLDALVAEMRENPDIFSRLEGLMGKHQQLTVNALDEARKIVRGKAQILSEGGQMQNEYNTTQVELCQRAKRLMASDSTLDYATALRMVGWRDPEFAERCESARRQYLSMSDARPVGSQDESVGLEIDTLTKEKIAASVGKTSYAAAMGWVLSEHPDLTKRWMASMRRG